MSVMYVFESLAKQKVNIQQQLKKLRLAVIKKVKFFDSKQVDVEIEEKTLARRRKLPKDAKIGSEFINRDDKIFQ